MIKNFKLKETLVSIALIILGILFITNSEDIVRILSRIIGIGILLVAAYNISEYFRKNKSSFYLFIAVVEVAVGIFFIVWYGTVETLINYAFGLYILFASLVELAEALRLRKKVDESLLPSYLLSGLGIVIAIFCFITTKKIMSDVFVKMLGVLMVVYGVVHIIGLTMLESYKNKAENNDNLIEAKVKEVKDDKDDKED